MLTINDPNDFLNNEPIMFDFPESATTPLVIEGPLTACPGVLLLDQTLGTFVSLKKRSNHGQEPSLGKRDPGLRCNPRNFKTNLRSPSP